MPCKHTTRFYKDNFSGILPLSIQSQNLYFVYKFIESCICNSWIWYNLTLLTAVCGWAGWQSFPNWHWRRHACGVGFLFVTFSDFAKRNCFFFFFCYRLMFFPIFTFSQLKLHEELVLLCICGLSFSLSFAGLIPINFISRFPCLQKLIQVWPWWQWRKSLMSHTMMLVGARSKLRTCGKCV